ncbi:restriction endonuclease [Paenibacillus massiliensis]|uniref:restriction endonuclease n=1 Tax=Paenibacillus massiliensis TaxID=225917 RepID=UPI000A052A35|nr:restriction endonuclease [Paenibacillus massiliensis]
MTKAPDQCELCRRTPVVTTVHHLTPREEGGSFLPTADLCVACHQHIHHLFTNRQLIELQLTTIEALQSNLQMASFLKWIRKQPASTIPRSRKSANVRQSRK